ncbi:exopolygalacturonase-like [Cornus florida]|uniref:exopolygalacturonase-like n=1 Tax=Cornus florida TaxID=4283 RepID=UPI002896F440|nr:exopolygalacturonase-like [Cornus florida]
MGLRLSLKTIYLLLILARAAEGAVYDVTKFGAKPNADIRQALLTAWRMACGTRTASTIIIPAATFSLSQILLQGPCGAPIGIELKGILKAPPLNQIKADAWVVFQKVDRLSLSGGGTFDGMGAEAWKTCVPKKKCPPRPSGVRLNYVNNSMINDITSKDPKMFHITVFGGTNVTFQRLTIVAPEDSRNTDGLHIARTSNIKVLDSKIGTGDDCISFGDGAQNIHIEKVKCGPGHGISIGSLGKYPSEQPVSGITVKDCTLTRTMYGARIKTWRGSPPSTASDIRFDGITMDNVANPIIIDQEYCDARFKCPAKPPSKVKISKVSFKNIKGSSKTPAAVKLLCSKDVPCENVEFGDIELTHNGGPAKSEITNVKPIACGRSGMVTERTSSQGSGQRVELGENLDVPNDQARLAALELQV